MASADEYDSDYDQDGDKDEFDVLRTVTIRKPLDRLWLAQDISKLPRKDIFEDIRRQFPTVEKNMRLNTEQKSAVLAAREALGGVQSIIGLPGTGKTHLIRQYLKPFLCAKERKMVLLQEQGNAMKNRYVVSVISSSVGGVMIGPSLGPSDPTSTMVYSGLTWSEIESMDNDNRTKLDRCVVYRMFQVAGIYQHPQITCPDKTRFKRFRRVMRLYIQGEKNKALYQCHLMSYARDLFEYTVSNASAVIMCVGSVGDPAVFWPIPKQLCVTLVDDASQTCEEDLKKIFSDKFEDVKIVMVGDRQILQTNSSANDEDIEISPLEVLTRNGAPYSMLCCQSRMIHDICSVSNNLVYANDLLSAPATKLHRRELATKFARWVQEQLPIQPVPEPYDRFAGLRSRNILAINVPQGGASFTKYDPLFGSRNVFYVALLVGKALSLLRIDPDATIAILTGHRPQYSLYNEAFEQLHAMQLVETGRITLGLFEEQTSAEYDYVLFDLPVGDKFSILEDCAIMTTVLTRARNGIVMVFNGQAIHSANAPGVYIRALIQYINKHATITNLSDVGRLPQGFVT